MRRIETPEQPLVFSDSQLWTMAHGLRVAAAKYADDARQLREAPTSGALERLAQHFDRQVIEAVQLADMLEGGSSATL